jgi:hypothetical protein
MLSRAIAITLGLLALSSWGCDRKDDSSNIDPGPPVDKPKVTRDVVDSGLVYLDMDADIYGGGGTGIDIPDAGPRPDVLHFLDAPPDTGGAGTLCDVFATKPCATDYGCYPKADGTATCQTAGSLSGGSRCVPTDTTRDTRCIPGYICEDYICTGLCQMGEASTKACADSIGTTCLHLGGADSVVGYCATSH